MKKVLAIDPSSGASSPVGYAIFEDGELVESGVIEVPKGNGSERLHHINECLRNDFEKPDVLVVEMIPRVRILKPVLTQSVGAIMSAWPCSEFVEVPVRSWKAYVEANPEATKGYEKGDEWDAIVIGLTYLSGSVNIEHNRKTRKRGGRRKRKSPKRKSKAGTLMKRKDDDGTSR